MDFEAALSRVVSSLQEGADLRMKVAQECGPSIVRAASAISDCLRSRGKLILFGNGGSAADAQHLSAEFVGRFVKERKALPAIALTTDTSILTAVGNDYGFDQVFSRQVEGLGRAGDIAIGISTSGNSPNVISAIRQCATQNMKTIGLAGRDGGELAKLVDFAITVSCANTARVQECHITVGHILCELVEADLFRD